MDHRVIALLGRTDAPTDGVEDYCRYLAEALALREVRLEIVRVDWEQLGWINALRTLWRQAAAWRASWVVVQYTALAWSRRGFPLGVLLVLWVLRRLGIRCAIVFHEPFRHIGSHPIDAVRGRCQDWVIRRLYAGATKCIFPDPLDTIPWLRSGSEKAFFIPIGANLPEPVTQQRTDRTQAVAGRTVAVFCVSGPRLRKRELDDIAYAMTCARRKGVKARVVFVGRGTAEAKDEIDRLFRDAGVEAVNLGLRSAHELRRILSDADAMLCVRGRLFMRRGSAIAGIACGLPIVGYAGDTQGTPLADAGVLLVPYLDREALATALVRLLEDDVLRCELRRKSMATQQEFFSWNSIVGRYLAVFGIERAETSPVREHTGANYPAVAPRSRPI